MSAALIALAERVEALAGPCRETDAWVFNAICCNGRTGEFPDQTAWVAAAIKFNWNTGRFTSSLDAAMTLVPEGEEWSVHRVEYDNKGCPAAIVNMSLPQVLAATPALALTAAALRARAAQVRP